MLGNGETVTVLTAGTVHDPYSDEDVPSWDVAPATADIDGVLVEPRPSSEPTQDARNAVVSGFTLYFQDEWPAITPQQRVNVRGDVYDVLGEPAEWRWPSGGLAGSVVQVGRTAG